MTTTSKYLTLIALSLLAGCATCREHPVTCAVVTGIVAGSIALTVDHRRHDEPIRLQQREGLCDPRIINQCVP